MFGQFNPPFLTFASLNPNSIKLYSNNHVDANERPIIYYNEDLLAMNRIKLLHNQAIVMTLKR